MFAIHAVCAQFMLHVCNSCPMFVFTVGTTLRQYTTCTVVQGGLLCPHFFFFFFFFSILFYPPRLLPPGAYRKHASVLSERH